MAPDAERASETRAWLAKARLDLRAAAVDLDAEPPLLADALFHCQQSVEKSLKAFLAWHDRAFRKTHDLVELGGQCVRIDAKLEPLLRKAAPLTEYAWLHRYPGAPAEPSDSECLDAVDLARTVHAAVLSRLRRPLRRR
jgi:HEPN domain-containing protein